MQDLNTNLAFRAGTDWLAYKKVRSECPTPDRQEKKLFDPVHLIVGDGLFHSVPEIIGKARIRRRQSIGLQHHREIRQ